MVSLLFEANRAQTVDADLDVYISFRLRVRTYLFRIFFLSEMDESGKIKQPLFRTCVHTYV